MKTKILVVGMTYNYGGIETNIYNIFKFLHKKYQFGFIKRSNKHIAFEDIFINHNCSIHKLTSYYINEKRYIDELIEVIKANAYKIVYCNFSSYKIAKIVKEIATRTNAKIIIHSHNITKHFPQNFFKDLNIKKMLLKYGDVFISCSNESAKSFFGKKILNCERYTQLNNLIDVDKFQFNTEKRCQIRKDLGIDNVLVLGNVGKISKNKNQKFVIKLVKKLNSTGIKTKGLFVGLVNNAPNNKDIIYTGMVSNVEDYMCAMDIFVFPSKTEGFGISVIEAQLMGLPVFASDKVPSITKISNLIKYLSLKGNKNNWIKSIMEIINRSKTRINIEYNNEIIVNKLIEIIEGVLSYG